jgi:hypothetical protein
MSHIRFRAFIVFFAFSRGHCRKSRLSQENAKTTEKKHQRFRNALANMLTGMGADLNKESSFRSTISAGRRVARASAMSSSWATTGGATLTTAGDDPAVEPNDIRLLMAPDLLRQPPLPPFSSKHQTCRPRDFIALHRARLPFFAIHCGKSLIQRNSPVKSVKLGEVILTQTGLGCGWFAVANPAGRCQSDSVDCNDCTEGWEGGKKEPIRPIGLQLEQSSSYLIGKMAYKPSPI